MSASKYGLNHDFTYNRIHSKMDRKDKRTKLICTIGPSSDSLETLCELIKRGMTVARLNFSHGDHESHTVKLNRIREAIKLCKAEGRVGIMLDTKGPEIRTGFLENNEKVSLVKNQKLKVTGDYSFKGNSEMISLSFPNVVQCMEVGNIILIGDGNLTLKVLEVHEDHLVTVVKNNYLLGERKNVNLPGVKVDLPVITEKDHRDIVEFGVKNQVDYIALSFTRTKKCVETCREVLGEKGKDIQVIPKIENQEGLQNIDEIVKASDGIMMARGDLGMELNPSKLLIAQKFMTSVCRRLGKPVICATQMLESMTTNSRPTRAEMSDVGNAVLDSVDSVMLSGETGGGVFVLESVDVMNNICLEVEDAFDNRGYFKQYKKIIEDSGDGINMDVVLAKSAAKLAFSLKCNCIIAIDSTGSVVKILSRMRTHASIIYPNYNMSVLNKLTLSFGILGVYCESKNDLDLINAARGFILEKGLAVSGKNAILIDIGNQNVKVLKI